MAMDKLNRVEEVVKIYVEAMDNLIEELPEVARFPHCREAYIDVLELIKNTKEEK